MFDNTPAATRVATGSQARVRPHRFSRSAGRSAARRGTPLHETLAVGLGLAQRP